MAAKTNKPAGSAGWGQPVSQSERSGLSVPSAGTGEGDQSLGKAGHRVAGERMAIPFSPKGIPTPGSRAGEKVGPC